jgi:hypothetical protein
MEAQLKVDQANITRSPYGEPCFFIGSGFPGFDWLLAAGCVKIFRR